MYIYIYIHYTYIHNLSSFVDIHSPEQFGHTGGSFGNQGLEFRVVLIRGKFGDLYSIKVSLGDYIYIPIIYVYMYI